jgi:hypothetical protein
MTQSIGSTQPTFPTAADTARTLVVDGLASCTIQAAEDGTWHVVAQLAPDDQATCAAAAPTPNELCRHAQHALGMAMVGSRIYRERCAIGVYTNSSPAQFGEATLFLDGPHVLWFVAHATPQTIHALLDSATLARAHASNH